MKVAPVLFALSILGSSLLADDRIRDAQAELKRQGFYYGEVDGNNGSETSAAIRRFQIRNGLEVTGQLNERTIDALDSSQATRELEVSNPPPAPAPAPVPPAPARQAAPSPPRPAPVNPAPAPPVNLRRDDSVEDSDRSFLRREEMKRSRPLPDDDHIVPRPRVIPEPTADLAMIFAETPYARAPLEVQDQTLRRAQGLLAQRGYYRDAIDGIPGPATEEAILGFQRSQRLPLTGRLDLSTLSALRLLPGRAPLKPFSPSSSTSTRVYRGVIVE